MTDKIKGIFNVRGMSCTGCEAVIERAISELDGIYAANANFVKSQVTVTYDPDKISPINIKAAVKKAGYRIEGENGNVTVTSGNNNDKSISRNQFIGLVVILLAVYLIINNTVGFNFIPEVTSSMNYGVLFLVGLLTSLHCVAMCGGINMSQCVNNGSASSGTSGRVRPSLLYNLGRVTSYTVIGGVIGALGSAVSFSGWARGIVAIISGLFMVIMGISMMGVFPWINKIIPRLPRVFREKAGKAGRGRGSYIVGLLNGFMPCGPLQAMQVYALGTGSFATGALSMFFFSLGTLPLMFGLGAFITMLGSKFTKKMMKASAVLLAVLGIIMLGRGLALSGLALPLFPPAPPAAVSETAPVVVEDGAQEINSEMTSRGYPAITVQKDVPVVWNLHAGAGTLNGCNRTVVISEYNIQMKLKEGDNIIKFTPTETGKFTYSCWMGMQTGQISVVD